MNTTHQSEGENKRSSVMTEVRAAVSIAIMLLVNVIALVYWAATLSADMRNLQVNVSELRNASTNNYTRAQAEIDLTKFRDDIKDHENRIRFLERTPSR